MSQDSIVARLAQLRRLSANTTDSHNQSDTSLRAHALYAAVASASHRHHAPLKQKRDSDTDSYDDADSADVCSSLKRHRREVFAFDSDATKLLENARRRDAAAFLASRAKFLSLSRLEEMQSIAAHTEQRVGIIASPDGDSANVVLSSPTKKKQKAGTPLKKRVTPRTK